jgi:hypothetical protein
MAPYIELLHGYMGYRGTEHCDGGETVETVKLVSIGSATPLKRGVNETSPISSGTAPMDWSNLPGADLM